MEREIKLAVLCNKKEITTDDFKVLVGMDFHSFWKNNKRSCLNAWREHVHSPKARKQIHRKRTAPIPCQFTSLALTELQPSSGQRMGHIVGYSRDHRCVYVVWDGNKTSQAYAKEFIEHRV